MRQLQASSSHVMLSRRGAAAAAAAAARCPTKRAHAGALPRATEPSPAAVSTMRPSGGFHTASPAAPAPAPATRTTAMSEATTAAAAAVATTTTSAEAYFRSLLRARGRSPAPTKLAFQQPTPKQVHDYGLRPFVSDLARKGDIAGLQKAMDAGRGMVSRRLPFFQVRTLAAQIVTKRGVFFPQLFWFSQGRASWLTRVVEKYEYICGDEITTRPHVSCAAVLILRVVPCVHAINSA